MYPECYSFSAGPGLLEEADVVGDDVGKGEIGGDGDDPAEGLGAFVEGPGAEDGKDGQSALDGGEDGRVFDEGLHDGIAFGEMGVLEAFSGGNEVRDIEGDQGEERSVEHGVAEAGAAKSGLADGLGGMDGHEPRVEVDFREIEVWARGRRGKKVERGEAVERSRRHRSFDEGRGGGQGDTGKEGEGENEGDDRFFHFGVSVVAHADIYSK
jgi:hypothetical protein